MNLVMATFPDDSAELAAWLDRQLVGLDLGRLAAELSAVHGDTSAVSLADVLGEYRSAVLNKGLAGLPPSHRAELLRQPALLLELQELVLTEGGAHWEALLGKPVLSDSVERVWRRLEPALPRVESRPKTLRLPRSRGTLWLALAAAAALLVGIGLTLWGNRSSSASGGWGWDRHGALAQDLSREDYLNRLADEALEWFVKRPENATELSHRIVQFRQGCSTLLAAEHRPLPAADHAWLRERCRAWAEQLDQRRSELETGRAPVEVRNDVDAIVRKLEKALRDRGRQAPA
jgi:hypothetical protein